jgi:hypothetical protein
VVVNNTAAYIEDNAVLTRIFARLPEHMRSSFTPEQLQALAQATYDRPTEHSVAIRKTFPWLGKRYYWAFFAGPDRRHKPTLAQAFVQSGLRRGWKHHVIMLLIFVSAMVGLYATVMAFGLSMTAIFATDVQNSPHHIRQLLN